MRVVRARGGYAREQGVERESEVTFRYEGGASESNSLRAPRVFRAWERGEPLFPAKKEQGSNNTVLEKALHCAGRTETLAARPHDQGRDKTGY